MFHNRGGIKLGSSGLVHTKANCFLGEPTIKGWNGTKTTLQIRPFDIEATTDLVEPELGKGDQLRGPIGPFFGKPHFVAVQMIQQACVVCENKLRTVGVRVGVLKKLNKVRGKARVQAAI
jgi:hypothetical protein